MPFILTLQESLRCQWHDVIASRNCVKKTKMFSTKYVFKRKPKATDKLLSGVYGGCLGKGRHSKNIY